MRQLTPEGQRAVEDVAARHGFSTEAVTVMLMALAASGGTMAQFSHPEFGGMGQWSQGGMTMIGDMFNNSLKARVDGLCAELSGLVARQPMMQPASSGQWQSQSSGGFGGGASGGSFSGGNEVSLFVPMGSGFSGNWWPDDLGQPSSTGQQNDIRYAVFPATRRLAIDIGGRLSVYDTLDHQIGGVSQQQSGDASVTFTSQRGLVRVRDLPLISGEPRKSEPAPAPVSAPIPTPEPVAETPPSLPETPPSVSSSEPAAAAPSMPEAIPQPKTQAAPQAAASSSPAQSADEIFSKLERLAELRTKGILTEDEFATKKAELLARL